MLCAMRGICEVGVAGNGENGPQGVYFPLWLRFNVAMHQFLSDIGFIGYSACYGNRPPVYPYRLPDTTWSPTIPIFLRGSLKMRRKCSITYTYTNFLAPRG